MRQYKLKQPKIVRPLHPSNDTPSSHSTTLFLRQLSTQCNRTYSDALPFSTTISRGTCPSLPHEAVATGWRKVNNFQGLWQVDDCELKWFLPHEACDLIGSVGKIILNGDSLIRQLTVGISVVLSGNYRTGALSKSAPSEYLEACQCERQWKCCSASGCRKNLGSERFGVGEHKSPQFDLCPKWTRDHIIWVQTKCTKLLKTNLKST